MDGFDAQEVGKLSANMLDLLELDCGKKDDDGITTKVGLIHIAVEVEHEDQNGDSWTEVYVQCNERRGWVKEAFLHRLAEFSEKMQDIEEVDHEDED